MFNADVVAKRVLEANGISADGPVDPVLLAYCLVGPENFVRVPMLRPAARWSAREGRLEIRAGMPPRREAFLILHELAHHILRHDLYWSEFIERQADALAAAFLVPEPALRWAVKQHGRRVSELAELFDTTQSIMLLRLGEVFGSPLALVTPRRVHVRGDIEWGPEEELRAMAVGTRPALPWFQREVLTDARRHFGLILTG